MENKIKPSVKILAIISLACAFVRIILNYDANNFNVLRFLQPIISIISCLLLTVFVFKFNSTVKIYNFMTVFFALFAVSNLITIINIVVSYLEYKSIESFTLNIIRELPELIQFIIFMIAAIKSTKDFPNKNSCLTALYLGIIMEPFKILLLYIFGGIISFNLALRLIIMIGSIAIYLAFIINIKSTKTPQEKLQYIKSQYGQGKITAEEYEKARASILKNL